MENIPKIIENEDHLLMTKEENPSLKASCKVFVDKELNKLLFSELSNPNHMSSLKQICSVASLPALVGNVVGLPDIHAGYGFPIGSVAAFNMNDPNCVVSPGGVGYDINCGVRALRTNLELKDIIANQKKIANALFDSIPCGVGDKSSSVCSEDMINQILDNGIRYMVQKNMVSEDNLTYTESNGTMEGNSKFVCQKAKERGMKQLGSLGSGNHYLEVQYVCDVYDEKMCNVLGLKKEQIVIFIHTGSRGLGHAVCHDYLMKLSKGTDYNDQLNATPLSLQISQEYLLAMGSAANFAFCNRAIIAKKTKKTLEKIFPHGKFELIYDVCHNIAKKEEHIVDGIKYDCLVHRKGASRAFPPGHPEVPEKYKEIGQPALIGGSMGTYSYILCGGPKSMELSFGSTCHGAGRSLSRHQAKKAFTHEEIVDELNKQGIIVRSATNMGIVEEAPGSYKDVDRVIEISDKIGLTKKACRLKPLVVIKG